MKIMVTGGAGFIGSHVVDAYIKAGHDVVVLDNLSTGKKEFINPKSKFYEMDLLDPKLGSIFQKENIEVINHHAAQASVGCSVNDPVFDAKSNIIGTLQLLQNAVSFSVRKIILASTGGAIYGDQDDLPVSEDAPCRPKSPYAIAKLSGEHYLRYYKENFHLDYVSLRYSNVFGPRQDPYGESGVIAIFCNLLLQKKSPIINGDGEQTRDFIYIEDVVRANILALQPDCKSGVFNIGTEKETTINNLTKQLLKASGQRIEIKYGPARKGEQRKSVICHQKIYETVGWKPNKTLEEGLIETYRYFSTFRL